MQKDGSTGRVHVAERYASLMVGGGLLTFGLRAGPPVGRIPAAIAGAGLVYHGASGKGPAIARVAPREGVLIQSERAITIDSSAKHLHEMWRDPTVLSRILEPHLTLEVLENDTLRWRFARAPMSSVSWTTRYAEDRPGECLRWVSESIENVPVAMEGALRFRPAPSDWGTEVFLQIAIRSQIRPVERIFEPLSRFFAIEALRRMKSLAETGEIPTLKGNPHAPRRGRGNGEV